MACFFNLDTLEPDAMLMDNMPTPLRSEPKPPTLKKTLTQKI